jgi:SAM-dependent methyltransferase
VPLRRRRRLKNAILRSRIPFKAQLARAYLRAMELYRSRREDRGGPTHAGGLALPPPRLRVLVAGTADAEWFLESGRVQAAHLRALLDRVGHPFDALGSVLDFGVGCGRIARWFDDDDGGRMHGCDYNGELVDWCQASLPFMRTRRTELEPPLPYPDDSFDFLYVFSVFTHLSVPLAERWMAELGRIVKPGGLVWFTIHGAGYRERLLPEEGERFDAGEIIVWLPEIEGTNLCCAYWPDAAVERMLGADFEVLDHLDPMRDPLDAKAALLEHDSYLIRRL